MYNFAISPFALLFISNIELWVNCYGRITICVEFQLWWEQVSPSLCRWLQRVVLNLLNLLNRRMWCFKQCPMIYVHCKKCFYVIKTQLILLYYWVFSRISQTQLALVLFLNTSIINVSNKVQYTLKHKQFQILTSWIFFCNMPPMVYDLTK